MLFIGCASEKTETTETNPSGDSQEQAQIDESWKDEDDSCPPSWLLTYALDGQIDITHTPLDMGNASALVGGRDQDELVIRVPDDNGVPAAGTILLTQFNLLQDFSVSVDMIGEFTVVSDLLSTANNECGAATGTLEETTIRWAQCTYGANHGEPAWSPDDGASGVGCIADYHVTGNIECIDNSLLVGCDNGWLDEGDNPQDYRYAQPLLELRFDSPALETFTMKGEEHGVELPTYANNRTWLTLEGTLKKQELTETPSCLCDN